MRDHSHTHIWECAHNTMETLSPIPAETEGSEGLKNNLPLYDVENSLSNIAVCLEGWESGV